MDITVDVGTFQDVNTLASSVGGSSNTSNDGVDDEGMDVAQLWVSPVPDWNTTIPIWGRAWPFHTYFFGSAFTVLMLVTLALLLGAMENRRVRHYRIFGRQRRRQAKSLLPPPVFSLIAFAAFIRALCLFADPYHSKRAFPTALARVLGTLPFTSFLCAYQLLFLALHSALRIEIGTLRWLSKRWLIFGAVAFFMIFNLAVDLILVLAVQLRVLLTLCMAANSAWLATIMVEFIINAVRLRRRIVETEATLGKRHAGLAMKALAMSGVTAAAAGSPKQVTTKRGPRGFRQSVRKLTRRLTTSSLFSSKKEKMEETLSLQRRILRMTVVLVATIGVYLALLLYYFLGTAGAFSFESLIKPWTWYAVTTLYRIVELVLSIAILLMLGQSQKKKRAGSDGTDSAWPSSMRQSARDVESQSNGVSHTTHSMPAAQSEECICELPAAAYYIRKKTMLVTAL